MAFAIGGDLLDVHRWRESIDENPLWIENAKAALRSKPEFSIGCLGDLWVIVAAKATYAVFEDRGPDAPRRTSHPA